MAKEVVAEAKNLAKSYRLGNRDVWALGGVSFTIEKGEFLAFVGSSGSGKTTLLNLLGAIDVQTRGQLEVHGKDLSSLSDLELAKFRSRELGFVFQTFNLLPVLSALENVEYPLLHRRLRKDEGRERARRILERVGLDKHENHRPDQLSGGQRQRVAIARALVHGPQLVIADEPTANLDKKTAGEILDLMRDLNNETGVTFVFSTHDPLIISRASRTIELSDGKIIQ